MAKARTYMITDIAKEFGVSQPRISQILRGYQRADGTVIQPELEEGVDYVYEVREYPGKVRRTRRVVPVLTEQGRKKIRAIIARPAGRRPKEKGK